MMKRVGRVVAWVIGGLMLAALVALGVLATIDLRPLLESRLSAALDRRVGIGMLHLGWDGGPTLRATDVWLANAPGADEPEMLRVVRLDAVIDWMPLLRGVLQYRHLQIDGLDLLLERLPGGTPNWRFAGGGGASIGHIAAVPKDRTQFPTLINARIRDSRVRYRTTGGTMLRIKMDDLTVIGAGNSEAMTIILEGSYNDTPGKLVVHGGSFAVMHEATTPYPAEITVTLAGTQLDFKGTLLHPLDFDGADGELRIESNAVGSILALLGGDLQASFPLTASGTLHRDGVRWQLEAASGQLAGSGFTGAITLIEGARGQPDGLEAKLSFDRLTIDPLIGGSGSGSMSLQLDPKAMRMQAELSAAEVRYHAMRLSAIELRFYLGDGRAELGNLAFGIYGGRVHATATMRSAGEASSISGQVAISDADLGLIALQAGAKAGDVSGRLGGHVMFYTTGATLPAALRASNGYAAVGMIGGRIARTLLELASTDLRALVRRGEGSVPVSCLFTVLDVRNGVARISPLRLRTGDATILGGGSLDLARQVIDLTIQTDRTGLFALDVPIRIEGPIQKPAVMPEILSDTLKRTTRLPAGLPPDIQQLAAANPCSR